MNIKTRRRTRIDIETHEVIVVRNTGERLPFVCDDCGRSVENGIMAIPVAAESLPAAVEDIPPAVKDILPAVQLLVRVQLRKNNANYGEASDIKLVTVNP